MVKPGDTVKVEQSLITVESDKASMEIPSSHAGVVKELKVKLGDKVNNGDLLAILEGAAARLRAAAPAAARRCSRARRAGRGRRAAAARGAVAAAARARARPRATLGLPHASPSVRKFARELGVPLDEVKGSGPKGRITADDVQGFTKAVMAGATQTQAQAAKAPAAPAGGGGSELGLLPWPKVDFAKFGPVERKDLGAHQEDQRRQPAPQLGHDSRTSPTTTTADITDLEAFRVQPTRRTRSPASRSRCWPS